ncbi:MAG: type II toxin-antitoxin system PemK/MazF family toxin [Actinobacteria bacterium]|nr:type II toxin-antitoxin system PemK/MazF family toxin [Actinomycetota bacterium]
MVGPHPQQGGIYRTDPDPTRGTEQAKPRPFAIVSVDQLNRARLGLSLAVPLTRTDFGSPLHLEIPALEGA